MKLTELQYKTYLTAAHCRDSEYDHGYKQGLRRNFLGAERISDEEHTAAMKRASQADDVYAAGYVAGFAGKPPLGLFHGNTGLRNAAKAVIADTIIRFRIATDTKAVFAEAAKAQGLTLSAWMMQHLTKAAADEGFELPPEA